MNSREKLNQTIIRNKFKNLKEEIKRLYIITDSDYEYCIGIVHKSIKEVKKVALAYFPESEYIDIRIKWKRNIDISKYPVGYAFDDTKGRLMEGLKLGVYDNSEYGNCLKCGDEGYVIHVEKDPFVLCQKCDNEMGNRCNYDK